MRISKTVVSRTALCVVLSFMACALTQMSVANSRDPDSHRQVTRPLRIQGQITFLDFLSGPPWTVVDQGWCSEVGHYVSVSKWSSQTEAFGILYAANGDQIFWEMSNGPVIFTGGTGRFENVSGSFMTTEIVDGVPSSGPKGTTTYPATYRGEGTITY
jgi:hypothetical protein